MNSECCNMFQSGLLQMKGSTHNGCKSVDTETVSLEGFTPHLQVQLWTPIFSIIAVKL